MTGAVFSFAGVECIAMAAAETRHPRRAIPAACRRVFLRVLLFYMLAVFVVGLLVSSADERLDAAAADAAQSPFVITASAAGIPAVPSVVNAVVITSAWSAANQSLLAGTRALYGLALKRQAPRLFLRTTSWGAPYACVLLFTLFMFLSFMSLSTSAFTVFWWLVNLTTAGVLVSWIAVLLNHVRLRLALKKQGIPVTRLPWYSSWTRKEPPPPRLSIGSPADARVSQCTARVPASVCALSSCSRAASPSSHGETGAPSTLFPLTCMSRHHPWATPPPC